LLERSSALYETKLYAEPSADRTTPISVILFLGGR
jgi:hypothetical protein